MNSRIRVRLAPVPLWPVTCAVTAWGVTFPKRPAYGPVANVVGYVGEAVVIEYVLKVIPRIALNVGAFAVPLMLASWVEVSGG